MLRTWLTSPMMPTAVPSANRAETIGRMAANTDPKTRRSTTRARSTPSPVLLKDGLFAFSARAPVTDTLSPSPDVPVTVSTNFFDSALEMSLGCFENWTGRKPTVLSALILLVSTRFPAAS